MAVFNTMDWVTDSKMDVRGMTAAEDREEIVQIAKMIAG